MKTKWTKEICLEISKKYNFRSDFKKQDEQAYNSCIKNKWLDEVCQHMEFKNKTYNKKDCEKIALQYNSRVEFQKNNPYVYLKCLKNKWLDEICNHMQYKHKPNNYWTKERCKEIISKYNNISDFKKQDSSVYRIVIKNKWFKELCNNLSYSNIHWTIEKCKLESLKYNNRTDFQNKSKGAYEFAKRNKILHKICSHMIKLGNKYKRCIYAFEFNDNHVYIGLTYNLEKRKNQHLKKGTVYNYLNNNSTYVLKQLSDYIDVFDAMKLEEKYISTYENEGWYILNIQRISTIGNYKLK